MCRGCGNRLRLHLGGKASLSLPQISLILHWPGLPPTRPCPKKFIISEEALQAARKQNWGHVLSKGVQGNSFQAFPWNWLGSAAGLVVEWWAGGRGGGEMYPSHMGVLILKVFLFGPPSPPVARSTSPATMCHSVQVALMLYQSHCTPARSAYCAIDLH